MLNRHTSNSFFAHATSEELSKDFVIRWANRSLKKLSPKSLSNGKFQLKDGKLTLISSKV